MTRKEDMAYDYLAGEQKMAEHKRCRQASKQEVVYKTVYRAAEPPLA